MMTWQRKTLKTYSQFMTSNPTWWEDTFTTAAGYDASKIAILKAIVYKWYRYRYLCTYDMDKFKVFLERAIADDYDRWTELTYLEALRKNANTLAELFVYNKSSYELESETGRTANNQIKNTGTSTSARDMDATYGGNESNTLTLNTTTTDNRDATVANTGTVKVENTGTQTTESTNSSTSSGSTSDTTNQSNDTRELATNLPMSVSATTGLFAAHFDGETGTLPWTTAGSKGQNKSTSAETASGTTSNSDSGESEDTRTDDLEQLTTDNTLQTTNDDNTQTRTGTETNARTRNLTDDISDTTTRTDNLTQTDTIDETTTTDTSYTTSGRTNHNPIEIINDAINKIIKFCSTEWVVAQLQPCFLLICDDFEDDWEDVEDE